MHNRKQCFSHFSFLLLFFFLMITWVFFSIEECTWPIPSHLEWRSPWRSWGAQSTMDTFLSPSSIARIQIEIIYRNIYPKHRLHKNVHKSLSLSCCIYKFILWFQTYGNIFQFKLNSLKTESEAWRPRNKTWRKHARIMISVLF